MVPRLLLQVATAARGMPVRLYDLWCPPRPVATGYKEWDHRFAAESLLSHGSDFGFQPAPEPAMEGGGA